MLKNQILALIVVCLLIALGQRKVYADDWKPLFTEGNLKGWSVVEGPRDAWKQKDGLLSCSGDGEGWLMTDQEFDNFELELEFRVPKGGNSGVFLRSPREGQPWVTGTEIQILDDYDTQYADLKPAQYTGSLYGVVAAAPRVSKPAGEWQKMTILLNGAKLKVTLNGKQVVEANFEEEAKKLPDHAGLKRKRGFLGLQNHSTQLDFRNLRIRELP